MVALVLSDAFILRIAPPGTYLLTYTYLLMMTCKHVGACVKVLLLLIGGVLWGLSGSAGGCHGA